MKTLMSFDSEPEDFTEIAHHGVRDAIRVAIARSVAEKITSEGLQDSTIQTKCTRAEIQWYMNYLYTAEQIKSINFDTMFKKVLEGLQTHSIIHLKTGVYEMRGQAVQERNRVIGVMITAHDKRVKPIKDVEPRIH